MIGYIVTGVSLLAACFIPVDSPFKATLDGSNRWFGWLSPFMTVFLWHQLFDGTPICRCQHSKWYRSIYGR